jgi:RNA polymerase sigma factor (sigma-70 family)
MKALTKNEAKLNDDQRRLAEEYAREWDPLKVLRSLWPGLYRKACYWGLDDGEIRGLGWEGVLRAALRFDPANGASFATYASYAIRSSVSRAVVRSQAAKRGVRPLSGDRVSRTQHGECSFWEVLGVAGGVPARVVPEENDRQAELRKHVAEAFRYLSPRHRRILELRHGFDGNGSRTLQEVARIFGLTHERIRQLELRAVERIGIFLQVRCIEHMRFGRGKYTRAA